LQRPTLPAKPKHDAPLPSAANQGQAPSLAQLKKITELSQIQHEESLLTALESQNKCSGVNFFRDDSTNHSKIIPNTTKFCKHITTTCCNESDFQALQYWWQLETLSQGSSLKETRVAKRKRRIQMVLLYTKALLDLYPKLKPAAKKIFHNKKSDRQCFEASTNFLSYNFPKTALNFENYKTDSQKCTKSINKLQQSFLCSSCDPNAMFNLDLESGLIKLDPKTCKFLHESCYETIATNIAHVYPFLDVVEPLVRCHRKNGALTSKHKYLLDTEQLIKAPIGDSKKFAPGVCEKVISFGENLNLSSEGDPGYLLGIYMNALGFLDETVDFSRKVLKVNQGKVNRDNQNSLPPNPKNERLLFMSGSDFLKRDLKDSQRSQTQQRQEIFDMARSLKHENRDIERKNRLASKSKTNPATLEVDLSKEIQKLKIHQKKHRGLVEDGQENSSFNEDDDEVAQDKQVDSESDNKKRALGDDGDDVDSGANDDGDDDELESDKKVDDESENGKRDLGSDGDDVDSGANDDGDDDELDSDKKVDSESENEKRRLTYYDFLYKTFDFDPKKTYAKGEVVKRKLEKCAKGKDCTIKAKKSKILRRRLENDDGEKE
jgi:hypothetical protein